MNNHVYKPPYRIERKRKKYIPKSQSKESYTHAHTDYNKINK